MDELTAMVRGQWKTRERALHIVRRASTYNLSAWLLRTQCIWGTTIEEKCYRIIVEATKTREVPLRLSRMTLAQTQGGGHNARDITEQFLQQWDSITGLHPIIIRYRQKRALTIASTIAPIKKSGTQSHECTCDHLHNWASGWRTANHQEQGEHVWCTWYDILTTMKGKGPHALQGMYRATLGHHTALPATTPLASSRHKVAQVTTNNLLQVLRTLTRHTGIATQAHWESITEALYHTVQAAIPTGPQRTLTPNVLRTLMPATDHMAGATLDKDPCKMRVSCQLLPHLELLATLQDTHIIHPEQDAHTSKMQNPRILTDTRILRGITRGKKLAQQQLYTEARTAPKAKQPGEKHRLIITYNRLRTGTTIASACRGIEQAVAWMHREGYQDDAVPSLREVTQTWDRFNSTLAALELTRPQRQHDRRAHGNPESPGHEKPAREPATGWTLTATKNDFVAFFLRVDRGQVRKALRYWTHSIKGEARDRPWMAIRKRHSILNDKRETTPLSTPHGRYEIPGVFRLQRKPGTDTDWDYIHIDAVTVQYDQTVPLRVQDHTIVQTSGLPIGSPCGGAGCRIYAAWRENMYYRVKTWAERTLCERHQGDPSAHTTPKNPYLQVPLVNGIRWVDDRYKLYISRGPRSTIPSLAMETLQYTGLRPLLAQPLARLAQQIMATHLDLGTMVRTLQTVLDRVVRCLTTEGMEQKLEQPDSVVDSS